MTIDPKVLKRIRVLARLADEKRNSSIHERESAALEFVKLIREHNIPIGEELLDEDEERKRRKKSRETSKPAPKRTKSSSSTTDGWSPPPWTPPPEPQGVNGTVVVMRFPTRCHFCGGMLRPGDTAFQLQDYGLLFIHDWPCRVED